MLSPAQIAALLVPYKTAPRGTIPLAPQNAPRGTISPFPNDNNASRGTIRKPRRRDLRTSEPTPQIPSAPRETNQIVPRGTTSEIQNAPRGTISPLPEIDWSTVHDKLAVYLQLILKWNAKTNLTAIRDPEQIVRRHFGESLFTGLVLGESGIVPRGASAPQSTTLLDLGSGAGFPGLPIQLLYPTLHVTLAESQGKKSAFLREAARALDLQTAVWSRRVEDMPADRGFEVVTLRAVDNMAAAVEQALLRARSTLAILTTSASPVPELPVSTSLTRAALPGSEAGLLLLAHLI